MSVSAESNIALKEFEKLSKHKDLEVETGRMWQLKVKTILVVVGALVLLKKKFAEFNKSIFGQPNIYKFFQFHCGHLKWILVIIN